ncbi:MAG: Uncharacterized conserved protein UCP019464, methanogenesis [Candidatus Syntrophoarchaeum caldarius]|uniref:Uncharacterized conserved protein UCP019464, methanogenesis n=1 Tax=Candidatus Syntropharchaeum caldarium TaxID=1838285 RepID=A0A1F2P8M1_9EURY|nr:MAG: Uncharacterized conserved protein UCP019464, methanogenesis [Candidatus Syntrophoarchaeum caldarius]
MDVFVECAEETGALAFQMLTESIIEDLHAGRLIERVREYIDIDIPLFYISIKPHRSTQKIEMRDLVSIIEATEDGIKVSIDDETYAPYLLPLLWEKYGDKVHQIERNRLEINGVTEDELMAIPIEDIKMKEIDDILNHIIFHVIPIGFRVIRNISEGDEIRYIASENSITDEMVEKVKKIVAKPPKELSLRREDILKPSKKTYVASYKESYV